MGVLHRIARAAQVIEGHVDIRVIDHPLENLAIRLEKTGPDWFGLAYGPADRPLKGFTLYRTLDPQEQAKLPLSTELSRFLRKPDFQLSPRQRKCPLPRLHRLPQVTRPTYPRPGPPPASRPGSTAVYRSSSVRSSPHTEIIVKTCGWGCFKRPAFRLIWQGSAGVMSTGRSSRFPLWNTAPARTRATRCGAFTARQRVCAASMSL